MIPGQKKERDWHDPPESGGDEESPTTTKTHNPVMKCIIETEAYYVILSILCILTVGTIALMSIALNSPPEDPLTRKEPLIVLAISYLYGIAVSPIVQWSLKMVRGDKK